MHLRCFRRRNHFPDRRAFTKHAVPAFTLTFSLSTAEFSAAPIVVVVVVLVLVLLLLVVVVVLLLLVVVVVVVVVVVLLALVR